MRRKLLAVLLPGLVFVRWLVHLVLILMAAGLVLAGLITHYLI